MMNIKKCAGTLLVPLAVATGVTGISVQNVVAAPKKTNFINIIMDDLGFSDIGVFGSEISTPNIDALATDGVMLTNFYAAATSTPGRAMLFTGKSNQVAGVGIMPSMVQHGDQINNPAYQGRLSLDVSTVPELLQQNGYYTMFTGKWDLSENSKNARVKHKDLTAADVWEIQQHDPVNRGFSVTRAALVPGGGNHYSQKDGTPWELKDSDLPPNLLYTENGLGIEKFPKEFYSTEYYTEMAIDMLENRDKNKPFYLCVSYTAPHNPLQAPQDVIAQYESVYSQGWEIIREKRFEKQKKLGLWPQDAQQPSIPDRPSYSKKARPWEKLDDEAKKISAKKMATYAAMIDILDQNIGELIDYLKKIGEYENTVIFIHSDNGGGYVTYNSHQDIYLNENEITYKDIGNRNTYIGVDYEWAVVKNTPFSGVKGDMRDAGWHTPAIVHYPKLKESSKGQHITSVTDFAATMFAMAGIDNTDLVGTPLTELTSGHLDDGQAERMIAYEMDGDLALRKGDWKLVKYCHENVQLFNLKKDPFEIEDLSGRNSVKLNELKKLYLQYATENGIVDLSGKEVPEKHRCLPL
jgi:arylsulfatase